MTKPFDPTKPVMQRNGRAARILCTDLKNDDFTIAARIDLGTSEQVVTFTSKGGYMQNYDHNCDLINIPEPKKKLTGWLNVYPSGRIQYLVSDEQARIYRGPECIACLDLSKYNIEYEEGEGL